MHGPMASIWPAAGQQAPWYDSGQEQRLNKLAFALVGSKEVMS